MQMKARFAHLSHKKDWNTSTTYNVLTFFLLDLFIWQILITNMMKLLSSLLPLIAILSCFSAEVSVRAKTLEGDAELQLLVGLETCLDHSEMNRIFATPNHNRHHKADKVALAEKARAHFATCLQLYRLSIDDHNKSNNNGGGGLELIPLTKDSS